VRTVSIAQTSYYFQNITTTSRMVHQI